MVGIGEGENGAGEGEGGVLFTARRIYLSVG
jgi:hypothetical protein